MASNHITDLVSTVTISKSEYEDLVRESNTLRIIENLVVNKSSEVKFNVLREVLGMYEESEDINATTD